MSGLTVILLFLCTSVSAAFLSRHRPVSASSNNRAIDQRCLELADEGSCDFYTCFEQRLPCGRNWYMLRTGLYYCQKVQRLRPHFSLQGQHFLNDTMACLTQSLTDLYESDSVVCQELENEAISAITPCFVENGFCDVFETDSSEFLRVFEFTDLLSVGASRVWRMVMSLAARCGTEALRELTSDVGETVIGTINGFFNSLSTSFDK